MGLGSLFLFILLGIGLIALVVDIYLIIKEKYWDKPRKEINQLRYDIDKLQRMHQKELCDIKKLIQEDKSFLSDILIEQYEDLITCYAWKEVYELNNEEYSTLNYCSNFQNVSKKKEVAKIINEKLVKSVEEHYKLQIIKLIFPELEAYFKSKNFNWEEIKNHSEFKTRREFLLLKQQLDFWQATKSNLTAIPYMAQIIADVETYDLENLAISLNWGYSEQRLKKVKSIKEIRKDAKAMVEKNKQAQYKLAYLLELFPALQDIIDCEFDQLPPLKIKALSEYDKAKDYLSKTEYQNLSCAERNQLALDNYKMSTNKTKWQIGRDYELYIGYLYSKKGYAVDYCGSYIELEDLGRNLICKKSGKNLLIQCKHFSENKFIHENNITQLYGAIISYCIENNIPKTKVKGILITNIQLSDKAKLIANALNIEYKENIPMEDYPCIKCNIGHDEFGLTKIYHLPFDPKYDETKINKFGEFFAMTVEEAEKAGFRRSFR